jgi:hypothetical protein
MHIRHLFTRYPHTRYGSYRTFADMSPDARASLAMLCAMLAIVGAMVASMTGLTGTLSFANPLVQWGWVAPSIIMTPFIIWRIATRSCATHDGLTFGNFLFRKIYLPSYGLTMFHVLMYAVLAYCPLLNLVCVIAGMVSIARCEFSINCSRGFVRQH